MKMEVVRMPNLSQIKRQRMMEFLQKIKEDHKDDDDMLIALGEIEAELNDKKYGLVWEKHQEAVDVMMHTHIPVFTECEEKEITIDEGGDYNFLLEGDNLHSLRLLQKTHKGKIDVIYIDPPYNTGNKDFIYDDSFVKKEDGFRHSKWLSFMSCRLDIAKELLGETGCIFISIGDNELASLKMLCDEIFGEMNFLSIVTRPTGTHTGVVNKALVGESDYILVYCKDINQCALDGLPLNEKDQKIYDMEDENGRFLIRPLRRTGGENRREDRPNMYFPITAPDGTIVYPIGPTGYESRWICNPEGYKYFESEGRIYWKKTNGKWQVYQKFYLQDKRKAVSNLWSELEGNKKATRELQSILKDDTLKFDYPKPTQLIKKIVRMWPYNNAMVLDFFAGSGTTAQAVMELNVEDGGNRRFILCTNNENQICEKITYPRLKTVITGKRDDGTSYSEGIPTNLKYYHTDFVCKDEENLSDKLIDHIKEMIQLEHGVKLDNYNYIMIMDDDEADDIAARWAEYPDIKALYVSKNVLFTTEQNTLFKDIDVHIIPDYYFNFELREVGESW